MYIYKVGFVRGGGIRNPNPNPDNLHSVKNKGFNSANERSSITAQFKIKPELARTLNNEIL